MLSLLGAALLSAVSGQVPVSTSGDADPTLPDGTRLIDMPLHSFDQEMEFLTFASRWENYGTSIPLSNHIMLSPAVADRFGAQWHKHPLRTNNFEVDFTLITKPPQVDATPHEQGFAFWYVNENVTDVIPPEMNRMISDVSLRMKDKGWGLFGYKNQFDGFGVIFANKRVSSDGSSELRPSISVITNDGTVSIDPLRDLPAVSGKHWNFRNARLRVKIRAHPEKIIVDVKPEGEGADWTRITDYSVPPNHRLRPGGYMGLTGSVSLNRKAAGQRGAVDTVMIDDLHLYNLDPNQKGEDEEVAVKRKKEKAPLTGIDKELAELWGDDGGEKDFLAAGSAAGQARIEGEAIKDLAHMVFKMMAENDPIKRAMSQQVGSLLEKVDLLEDTIDDLKEEMDAAAGRNLNDDIVTLKKELTDLSRQASADYSAKHEHLDKINSELMSLKAQGMSGGNPKLTSTLAEIQGRTKELHSSLSERSNSLMYLVLFCMVAIATAGGVMYMKFRAWEKKHIL